MRKTIKYIALFAIIFSLLASIGVAYCLANEDTKPVKTDDNSIIITGPKTDEVPPIDANAGVYIAPSYTQSNSVSIPGKSKMTFPANLMEDISVDFYNPETNKDMFYLTFEIRIPAENELGYEVIYQSGLVEPGCRIDKINISKSLKAGEYNAVIHVQPYRISDNSPTNNADLKVLLIVE